MVLLAKLKVRIWKDEMERAEEVDAADSALISLLSLSAYFMTSFISNHHLKTL